MILPPGYGYGSRFHSSAGYHPVLRLRSTPVRTVGLPPRVTVTHHTPLPLVLQLVGSVTLVLHRSTRSLPGSTLVVRTVTVPAVHVYVVTLRFGYTFTPVPATFAVTVTRFCRLVHGTFGYTRLRCGSLDYRTPVTFTGLVGLRFVWLPAFVHTAHRFYGLDYAFGSCLRLPVTVAVTHGLPRCTLYGSCLVPVAFAARGYATFPHWFPHTFGWFTFVLHTHALHAVCYRLPAVTLVQHLPAVTLPHRLVYMQLHVLAVTCRWFSWLPRVILPHVAPVTGCYLTVVTPQFYWFYTPILVLIWLPLPVLHVWLHTLRLRLHTLLVPQV